MRLPSNLSSKQMLCLRNMSDRLVFESLLATESVALKVESC